MKEENIRGLSVKSLMSAISFVTFVLLSFSSFAWANQLTMIHHLEPSVAEEVENLLGEIASEYGVEVNLVRVGPLQLVEKTLVMAAGGEMPDIIRIDQQHVRALGVANLLEDLNAYIDKENINLNEDFIPGSPEAFAYKDKQYAIPADTSSLAFFYNKSLFDAAGLERPASNWSVDGNWLWEDFVHAARRFTDVEGTGGSIRRYGIETVRDFYYWPWIWGVDWVDESVSEFYGNSPGIVEALQRLADLNVQDGVVGGKLIDGTAAMTVSGNWELATLREARDLDWAVGVYPQGTTRTTVFYPDAFAISSTSKYKEIAWEIIKALTLDEETVRKYTDLSDRVPSHRTTWEYFLTSRESLFPGRQIQVFIESLLYSKVWTMRYATTWNQIDPLLKRAWSDIWNGRKSAAQAMAEVTPNVDALLKESKEEEER